MAGAGAGAGASAGAWCGRMRWVWVAGAAGPVSAFIQQGRPNTVNQVSNFFSGRLGFVWTGLGWLA